MQVIDTVNSLVFVGILTCLVVLAGAGICSLWNLFRVRKRMELGTYE